VVEQSFSLKGAGGGASFPNSVELVEGASVTPVAPSPNCAGKLDVHGATMNVSVEGKGKIK
jgi:hypothetical protein